MVPRRTRQAPGASRERGSPSSRPTRWWRGTAVAGVVLVLVAAILGGVTLMRGIMAGDDSPPMGNGPRTAVLVDGRLVITNPDGSMTIVDISTLNLPDGEASKVLLAADGVYVASFRAGTVVRVDPANGARVGPAWSANGSIIDVAIDEADTVWVLGTDGLLHSLRWTGDGLVAAGEPTPNPGVGQDSTLVQHAAGVTLVDTHSGEVVRFGTDIDGTVALPDVGPALVTPVRASAHFIPLAVKNQPTALLVKRDEVLVVDLGQFGCDAAGSSLGQDAYAVFVCPGAGKALMFDDDGNYVPPDIKLGASGELVLSWDSETGRIFVSLPGGPAMTIDKDGTRSSVEIGIPGAGGIVPPSDQGGGDGDGGEPPGSTTSPTPSTTNSALPPAPTVPIEGDIVVTNVTPQQHTYQGPADPQQCDAIAVELQNAQYYYDPNDPYYQMYLAQLYYAAQQACATVTSVYFTYTANLTPPVTWRDFDGTCTLLVTPDSGTPTPQAINCGATTAELGYGTGARWTVSVRACDAAAVCVTSARVPVPTTAPS